MDHEISAKQPEEIEYNWSETLPFHPRCFHSSRWWFVLPVLLPNKRYHGVTFLHDTGSPVTFLEKNTRDRLELGSKFWTEKGHVVDLDICGVDIRGYFSEESGNPHAKNINILGADFTDTCYIGSVKRQVWGR